MSPVQKSLLSGLALVASCGAVIAGISSRDNADRHPGGTAGLLRNSLASLSNAPPSASPDDYYEAISELLNRYYVDPISDEGKLTLGAVRGMVLSLDDPDCMFMDPAEFKTFLNARSGKYEGIGVDLSLEMSHSSSNRSPAQSNSDSQSGPPQPSAGVRVPALEVSGVVPGGPADKAGIRIGDTVESIDGHWVLSPFELDRYNRLRQDANAGKATWDQLINADRDLRAKLASSVMPAKARDRLLTGTGGSLKMEVRRDGKLLPLTVEKAASAEEAAYKESNGAIALHFFTGAAAKLKTVIGEGPVTLDLRNNNLGDPTEMKKCLSLFAPAGSYGEIANEKNKPSRPLKIETGEKPRSLKLVVDSSTKGVAAIFALALQTKGYAELVGGQVSPDRNIIEVVRLPDGSGYTLATGKYVASMPRRAA